MTAEMEDPADIIAAIDRMVKTTRSEMARLSQHRRRLALENPAALPLQDAIVERAVRGAGVAAVLATVEQVLGRDDLTEAVRLRLDGLHRECLDLSMHPASWE